MWMQAAANFAKRVFTLNDPIAYSFFNVLDDGAVFNPGMSMSRSQWWNRSPTAHRCVDIIASSIMQLPIELYGGKQGTKPILKHPFLDLMANPNPYMTTEQLMYFTAAMMVLDGECFWFLERRGSAQNMPIGIWLVSRDSMKENLSKTFPQNLLSWTLRTPNGTTIPIIPQDVCQFKFPNPLNIWRGMSKLEAAGLSIQTEIEAKKFNWNYFKNNAIPSAILETDKYMTPVAVRDLIDRWNLRGQGTERAHGIQVAYNGLKFKSIQSNLKDMDFAEGTKRWREDIAMVLGVPPVKLGLLDGATYANTDAQKEIFWTDTVIPQNSLIQGTWDKQIVKDGNQSWLATEHILDLQEILNRRLDVAKKFFDMGYPMNKVNKRVDLGMDDTKWGDEGFLPYTLTPASSLAEGESDKTGEVGDNTGAPSGQDDKNKDDAGSGDTTKAWAAASQRIADSFAARLQARRPPKSGRRSDGPFKDVQIGRRVAGRTVYDVILDYVPADGVYQPFSVRGASAGRISSVLSVVNEDKGRLKNISLAYIQRGTRTGIDQMNELMNTDFTMANPAAVKFIDEKLIKLEGVDDTVIDQLRDTLSDGLEAGEGYAELSARVEQVYGVAQSRARTIARTEISGSANGGRFMVMKAEGATNHEWVDSKDERTRESHTEEGDSDAVAIGDEFPITHLIYPGDPEGEPAEIINCRCITLPVDPNGGKEKTAALRLQWRAVVDQWFHIEKQYRAKLKTYFSDQKGMVLKELAKITD